MQNNFIVFDVETPNHFNDRISAIGITFIRYGKIDGGFYTLVNPETTFDDFNTELTGISTADVTDEMTFPRLWKSIGAVMSKYPLVAHNAQFDLGVLKACLNHYNISWKSEVEYLCTVQMGRQLLPGMKHNLNVLCDHYHIPLDHHQADSDSQACAEILLQYIKDGADVEEFIKTYRMI